ncbi:MAG: LysR family transcriptional regulator [Rhizobacter sp.]|nr:LysR family transcriptional regulator [Burkholderiales bacterium]
MSINFELLAAFVQVAHLRSVSAAAARLGTSKSVVSKRVATLETQLSATLFSRSTRRVALTPAGEIYVAFAERVVSEAEAAAHAVSNLRADASGVQRGSIRVTAPVSWGQHVLARRLPLFLQRHTEVAIELILSDQMMDLAYERVDVALRWSAAAPRGLAIEPVALVRWVVVASPDYLSQASVPLTPDALAQHECMCYWRAAGDDAWVFATDSERVAVQVHSRYHANNPETVYAAARLHLGIALLPHYVCAEALAAGELVQVLCDWRPETQFGDYISAVSLPEKMRVARIRTLIEFLREAG